MARAIDYYVTLIRRAGDHTAHRLQRAPWLGIARWTGGVVAFAVIAKRSLVIGHDAGGDLGAFGDGDGETVSTEIAEHFAATIDGALGILSHTYR